jgi:uncharacterized protein YneF (UPF0154 family)
VTTVSLVVSHLVFFVVGLAGGWFIAHRSFKRALLQANAMFQQQHNRAVAIANQRLTELEELASAYREVVARSRARQ